MTSRSLLLGNGGLEENYRISKAISFNFGYTGMWLSQIARASSNTTYRKALFKRNPAAARNQTATIENNVATNPGGRLQCVNPQGFPVTGYTTTPVAAPSEPLTSGGARYVPATITYGNGNGARTVRNPEEFLELQEKRIHNKAREFRQ